MSDRLDETLRAMAQAHAPADLPARVRVALEAGPRTAPLWPKLAAAAVVGLLAVGGWLALDQRGAEAPLPHARETDGGGGASAPRVPPPPEKRRAEAPPPQSTVQVAPRGADAPPPHTPADHEHALPSLGALAGVGPAALATEPMVVVPQPLAPLTPIDAIEIPALDADGGERR
jgi:hypothetical protein